MQIGNIIVKTPFIELGDDAVSVAGNWVHELAKAAVDAGITPGSLPRVIRSCPEYRVLVMHARFLKTPDAAFHNPRIPRVLQLHRIATSWAAAPEGPRAYLDAMLLGGKPFEDIAKHIDNGRTTLEDCLALVEIYETLFMHCRKPDGSLLPPSQLKLLALGGRIELLPADPKPIHLRYCAACEGYEAVELAWGDRPSDGDTYIDNRFQSMRHDSVELIGGRVRAGSVDNDQLIGLIGIAEAREKRRSEERLAAMSGDASGETQAFQLFSELLSRMKPTRVSVEEYSGDIKESTAADKRNLASDNEIRQTVVVDRGPLVVRDEQDKRVNEHLNKQAEGQPRPSQVEKK